MTRDTLHQTLSGAGQARWLAVSLVGFFLTSCDANRYPTRDASADMKRESGPVNITGKLNPCPEVVVVVAPSRTTVGSSVDLSGHASDPDQDTLTFRWKAENGSFSHQMSADTTYTCPAAGAFVVTLTVNDGDCDAVESTTVLCMPGDAGVDGGADAGNRDGGSQDGGSDARTDAATGTGGGGSGGGGGMTGSGGATSGSGGTAAGTGGRVGTGGGAGGVPGGTGGGGGMSAGAAGAGGAATSGGSGGAASGSGGTTAGTGGQTGGGSCDQCGMDSCEPTDGCYTLTNAADRQLCQTAYDCVAQKKCAEGGEPVSCFCGTAGATCTADGAADGVCLAEIAAAAKTEPSMGSQIYRRFNDGAFPIGRAMNLVICQFSLCPAECNSRFGW